MFGLQRAHAWTAVLFTTSVVIFGLIPAAQAQTTWYVDDDAPNDPGPGDPNVSDPDEDGSPEHPFDAIQEGIDATQDGDTVLVLDGIYTGPGNRDLDFGGRLITVRSENGPDNCIIDCQGSEVDPHRGFYFHSGETAAAVVQGLTIRNGYVDQDTPGRYGGGVYCGPDSSPTLSNCTITANSVYGMGGGVYCRESSPTLTDCTIAGNSCNFMGAGVYCSNASPTLSNCTITDNTAEDWGAGVHCSNNSSPTLTNCTITDNTCIYGYGAGVCFEAWSSGTLTGCTIAGNSAHGGGGVYCYRSSPTLANCVFTGNTATQGFGYGGAVFCVAGANPTLTNCTITGNMANYGGGVFCEDSSPRLTNCILWGDDAYSGPEIYLSAYEGASTLTVSYSDVDGGEDAAYVEDGCTLIWGEGNIDEDPLFADPDNDDYHLSSDSLCINAGSNYAPALPDEDIEGNPRIQQCRVDMGAYESPYAGTFEDCNENGVDDDCDIYEGTSADCNQNHVPDECDIADGTSEDANGNGVPDECEEACQANELAKLLAADGAATDNFGRSVSISGDTAVIGAPRNDDNGDGSGSAYVLRYDGSSWIEEAKLLASDGAAGDEFGRSAALFGDTVVIGATGYPSAAYVFRYDGSSWVEEAKLVASDGPGNNYGEFVSISGDCVVVGAWSDDDNGSASGSAYVFRYDGWTWVEEAKLLASDGAAGDNFGNGVAVFGDTVLVGGRGNDDNGTDSGSAYAFRYDGSTWVEEAKLLPLDATAGDRFGDSVGLSGDIALVGAFRDDDNGDNSGSAYVFRYDGSHWLEQAKLLPSDGAPEDWFGYLDCVAISDDTAVVSAFRHDDNGSNSGAAYVFHGLSDCQPSGVLDICDIVNGFSDDDNGNGIPDECECPGDIDGDGDTDHSDLGELLAGWCAHKGDPNWNPNADLDGDAHVGQGDLGILLADWGCTP